MSSDASKSRMRSAVKNTPNVPTPRSILVPLKADIAGSKSGIVNTEASASLVLTCMKSSNSSKLNCSDAAGILSMSTSSDTLKGGSVMWSNSPFVMFFTTLWKTSSAQSMAACEMFLISLPNSWTVSPIALLMLNPVSNFSSAVASLLM
jgi:hypothetical protein